VRTSFPVSAPPEAWAALGDPARLAAALPGARSVRATAGGDGSGDGAGDGLAVVADLAVASVRGLWSGTVTPLSADEVRIAGAGAPGSVDLVVRASPDRTTLTVEGEVGGPLATVGGAVVAAAARRLAETTLAALADPARPPAGSAPGVAPATRPEDGRAARRSRGRLAAAGAGTAVVVVTVIRRWRRSHR
jgi:carbon monoxide dehydrogenase subunit G